MSSKSKRPSLTALLREPLPAAQLTPQEQQRIQTENDQKLYGTRQPLTAAAPEAPPVSTMPPPVAGGIVGDRWIPFGTYLHDQVYLTLKQAEFWEPGFEIRKFVNQVLLDALAQLPNAQRELPAEQLAAVIKKVNRVKP